MRIAIAGYGVEGEENYRYWLSKGNDDITIVDERADAGNIYPYGANTILGPSVFNNLNGYDLVVRTAGLAPYKISTNGKIWSGTNEFFAQCPAKIIGVTGSKGKGTTSSLITSILRAAGKKVWLVGNIGLPALSVLSKIQPDDIVVYELSSFQLWDIEKSPQTAVVLFIEREHLDIHRGMDEYIQAKARITNYQTANDLLIYNANNKFAEQIAEKSVAQKIGFPSENNAHVYDGYFYYGDKAICSVDVLNIKGEHNQQNAVAAINAIWEFTQNPSVIAEGLGAFKGLDHRLAYVDTVNGVEYYDDSIATTPASAIAALKTFANQPKVIILGGSYKGSDFSELANELTKHDVKAVLIGDEANTIATACEAAGFRNYEIIENATAQLFTRRAAELARPGGVVLLSPASASFGMFKNYVDRGQQFIAAVKSL